MPLCRNQVSTKRGRAAARPSSSSAAGRNRQAMSSIPRLIVSVSSMAAARCSLRRHVLMALQARRSAVTCCPMSSCSERDSRRACSSSAASSLSTTPVPVGLCDRSGSFGGGAGVVVHRSSALTVRNLTGQVELLGSPKTLAGRALAGRRPARTSERRVPLRLEASLAGSAEFLLLLQAADHNSTVADHAVVQNASRLAEAERDDQRFPYDWSTRYAVLRRQVPSRHRYGFWIPYFRILPSSVAADAQVPWPPPPSSSLRASMPRGWRGARSGRVS